MNLETSIKLERMSDAEYSFWMPRCRTNYINDKMRANKLTLAEATKIADNDFQRLLPNGLSSEGSFLFTAKDKNQNQIGFIWLAIRGIDTKKAFICDIVVEEKFRGKGYGRKIMLLIEEESKKLGVQQIGLHVFGFNDPAINLYKSMGYLTTDLAMEKDLAK